MNTIVKPPVKTPNKAPEKNPEPSSHSRSAARSMFDPVIVMPAIADSFRKLNPRTQLRNPVMFCVYVGSILTSVLWVAALSGQAEAPAGFILAVSLWLWFTVLFANFAEALAEGRSKAQAASLRSAKRDVMAKNPENVAKYKSGNEGVFKFFVGQVMRATRGQANPQAVNDILRQLLS